MRTTRGAAVVATAAALTAGLAAPAQADGHLPDGVTVVAEGLAGPLQVEVAPNGTVYVTEAFTGQVTRIDRRGDRSVFAAFPGAFTPGIGVKGGQVLLTVTTEEPGEDPEGPGTTVGADLVTLTPSGREVRRVDLLAYELAANPDGQDQAAPDALTNPYDVLALPGRTLVADAGGNVINQVRANGEVSTLTVLPVSLEPPCDTSPNNTESGVGCDPVPTGIVLGPDGYLYVSGLGAEVEGHVWKIDPRTGAIVAAWSGLPPLTGIAVAPDGTLYVSGIDDFETGEGRVLRLDPATGEVTGEVALPFPTGLTWHHDGLLVTSGFTGTLFHVDAGAFGA